MPGIRLLLSTVLVGLLLCMQASAATPEEIVQQAMSNIAPGYNVEAAQESQVPGFYEAIVSGQFVYVTKDGKHVLVGSAFDATSKHDLTEASRAGTRKGTLAKIGADKRIAFAPAKTRHTVTVFTDIDCPFCRRFHDQVAQYNAVGIAVDYVFYPLSIHPGADKKAEAVWCSKDRKAAFTAAMSGQDPGQATCPNPVAETTQYAQTMGITGTPTILDANGELVPAQIAMSPDQLAAELDRRAQASTTNH